MPTKRRTLLTVYVRDPGSARRYTNTETGENISYNEYRRRANQSSSSSFAEKRGKFEADLVSSNGDLNRVLESGGYSKRFVAAYKKDTPTERNIFTKVKGRHVVNRPRAWWYTYINQDGNREDAPFYGENLHDMQERRRAIQMRDRATLNRLAIKHRKGVTDANGVVRHPEFDLKQVMDVERKMSKSERAAFKRSEYYSDKQAEAA
jgi:hypothetical protein